MLNILIRLLTVVLTVCLVTGCSSMRITTYSSPALTSFKINKIAIMPIVITGGSTVSVSSNSSPNWISETYSTRSLSAAEYFPAEQAYLNQLQKIFGKNKIIIPSTINEAMKTNVVKTYNQAIVKVSQEVMADGVLAFRLRDISSQGGSQLNGQPRVVGHVDISLYDNAGNALWAVSGEAHYTQFGTIFSPAPSLSSFVVYIMKQFEPKLIELKKELVH